MLTRETIREITQKYQTRETNVIREYVQHIFLSSFYKTAGSEKILFKGGTALRIIFGSPRFSEDLDFTGINIHRTKEIDNNFLEALSIASNYGIPLEISEAKKTSGGYLGLITFELYGYREKIKFEVSLRKTGSKKTEIITIVNDFMPAYTLYHLNSAMLVNEKILALLDRDKPRDWYDLYFILRHPKLRGLVRNNQLKEICKKLEASKINFKSELSVLLPISHHAILRDFKKVLASEINKYI